MPDGRTLILDVIRRPGMFLVEDNYRAFASFVLAIDITLDREPLRGFQLFVEEKLLGGKATPVLWPMIIDRFANDSRKPPLVDDQAKISLLSGLLTEFLLEQTPQVAE